MMVYQPAYARSGHRYQVPQALDEVDCNGQMLRYAHDLHDLMQAHATLSREHQSLLLSLGRSSVQPAGVLTDSAGHGTEPANGSALHDPVTGLPNQLLLDEQLNLSLHLAQYRGQYFALLYIGLDGIGLFDSSAQQLVLREVTGRLQRAVRDNDLVSRVTTDVFGVVLAGTHLQADIRLVAENLLTAMSAPVYIGKDRIRVTCNMGCARYPLDGTDAHMLRKNAAEALCFAQLEGGSHLHFHDAASQSERPFSLGLSIWGAIERGEMHLVYQPRVSLGPIPVITGCEALVRWYHPMKGVIAPSVFIPVAERNGAILALGDWVLERAINQAACWHGSGMAGLRVSINVSPLQLDAPDFVDRVTALAACAGVDAQCIELEITESLAEGPTVPRLGTLAKLRQSGFRVALVDCGKGLSFLSGTQPLPIDCLKIDRQLIQQLHHNELAKAMTRCVVDMGKALGIDVVADGVETDVQLAVLVSQGCHLVQGFLTGRPMSPQVLSGCLTGSAAEQDAFSAMGAS